MTIASFSYADHCLLLEPGFRLLASPQTHYISSNYSASTVKRAVVMVHGDDRVSWNMQIYTNKALLRATSGGGVDYGDVVLVAP